MLEQGYNYKLLPESEVILPNCQLPCGCAYMDSIQVAVCKEHS